MPFQEDSSDAESNARDSGSDSEGKGGGSGSSSSSRSGSPASHGVAPTPGSPAFGSPHSVQSARSQQSGSPRSDRSQSRPLSGQSGRSPSPDSRPGSAQSHHSASSSRSAQSNRSGSPQSHHSGSPQYVPSERPESHHSGTPQSNRSGSPGSVTSKHTRSSKSRSKSPQSHASESPRSEHGSERSKSAPGSPPSNVQSPGSRASYVQSRSPSPSDIPAETAPGLEDDKSNSETEHKDSDHEDAGSVKSVSKGVDEEKSDHEATPKGKSDDDLGSGDEEERKRKRSTGSDGSGSEKAVRQRKKRAVLDSDSDGETAGARPPQRALEASGSEEEDATAAALFGDADDISSDEDDKKDKSPRRGSVAGSGDERQRSREASRERSRSRSRDRSRSRSRDGSEDRVARGDEEEEAEKEVDEPPPETRIDVEIPRIASDLGRELHFVKLPNFLSVETRPFDEDYYEDEIDEEETLDEEGRARLKLKVENTLRWRETIDKQGETIKQSNARLVKWSDGSMSLHLGSEIFDVHKQPLLGDHNHLFVRQGTGLQGQAVFRTKLSFRPHSTESFTHRKMTLSLADRSTKTPGIKILTLPVGRDPDQNRGQMIKKEEEKLRASVRRESKQKRVRERGAGGRLSAGYLEPDGDGSDDEGAISINAIKNKHKRAAASSKGDSRQPIYSSDEDGSDFETRRGKKSEHARALKDSDDSDDSNASDQSGGEAARASARSASPAGSDDD